MQVFPRLIQLLFCFQSVCLGFIFGKTFLKSEFVRKSEKVSGFLARWLRRCGSWRTRRCSASTAPSSTRPRSRRWDEAHKTQRQSQSGRIFTPSTSFARGSFVSNLLSVKHQWQVNESQKENVENLQKKIQCKAQTLFYAWYKANIVTLAKQWFNSRSGMWQGVPRIWSPTSSTTTVGTRTGMSG